MFRSRLASILVLSLATLLGGLPAAHAAGKGVPKGFELFFSPQPYNFRLSIAGEPVRRGATSERFELRPGDCGGTDCGNPWTRSELRQRESFNKARLNKDIWYGWSFYAQAVPMVTKANSLGAVFGQWKRTADDPAAFRFAQLPGPSGEVAIELSDMKQALNWGAAQKNGFVCSLFNLKQVQGQWVDIVVQTNFGSTAEGYLNVWVNGQPRCAYKGQIVSDQTARGMGKGPSARYGIFLANTTRWANTGAAPWPPVVVFYDEFLIGKARGEVDTRAREASGLAPKD